MPLRSAGGCMLHCVRVRGADRSGCPARPWRAARKPMRRTDIGRVAAPEQGGRPALPMRRACGDVRGVCPILVLVNRLQKEHPA
ncbi:hypothetical protein HU230_0040775 [Bradyrhizobium quebecense]|uniref:hypothetical protein n=1 Tax=Bradyrhizobium quebecense TaxID=2748629 RepID=UPI001CD2B54A|nr:hypothetical protein [Bradyrhizobium quebecense]UGA44390.1 hypothetical protein HU230_0040775 [Bradyrhizobium quebecense]